ncbi:MAG: hypothetical protein ACREKL_08355 [Chthoniobacterales bacterium]
MNLKTATARYLICIFGLVTPAFAATISYVPQTSTIISPGGTVTVNIYGTSVDAIAGYSLYLNSSATGNFIQLTSQALNTSLFTYGGPAPSFPITLSTTAPLKDIGAFSISTLAADTPYLLSTATFTFGISTPAGAYSIGNTAGSLFTADFIGFDPAAINTFNITVIPEPSAWGALAAGGLVVLIGARKLSRRRLRAPQ